MLTENDVIRLTCQKLITMGYEIVQRLHTTQHGVDIIASKDGHMLLIEAKGATSATENTNRYGMEFSNNQVKHHVAMALYAIAKLMTINAEETNIFCIALPNNENHINAVNAIDKVIKRLDIKLIWVRENGEVFILVKDNGAGIKEEIMKKIFQPFFTGRKEGHGLGLPIAYKIIHEAHGGDIKVHSEEGKGTEFRLFIGKKITA